MDNFDEAWLAEIGFANRPEVEKQAFLAHLNEEREVLVGQRLAVGLPEDKVAEFERIIADDEPTISQIIGDYEKNPFYQAMVTGGGFTPHAPDTKRELASLLWLNANRSDYQELINQVTAELKTQVAARKDQL
jgi:hypothetical protein